MNKIDTEVIKFALAQSPHLTDEQIATDYKVSTEDVASIRTPSPSTKKETLKEYARRYILEMSEDEKKEFVRKIPAELLWKMSEGNPHSSDDLTVKHIIPTPIMSLDVPIKAELLSPPVALHNDDEDVK